MEKNEIKKFLYREKPNAIFMYVRESIAYYKVESVPIIFFEVPVAEMGKADLLSVMDAKLLIRYLV